MKALVYQGPDEKSWTTVPDPGIEDPRDVVIRVDSVAICGTDLHILKGDVPEVKAGRVLGHEAVGTVVEKGPAVDTTKVGDRVLASCISACGRCSYCRRGRYGQCLGGGGWILGHLIDGVQAEYARIPFSDLSTHPLPDELSDDVAVLLADVLPTSYEVGVLNADIRPGCVVAVVGCGPIGLAAMLTARLYSPANIVAIDVTSDRLNAAARFAGITENAHGDPEGAVRAITGGLGADVAIEAVGTPEAFELCTRLVRPGGRVANIGVHGDPAVLHLETLWARDITITTGLVDTYSIPELISMLTGHLIDPGDLLTHRYPIDSMLEAYEAFADPAGSRALKIVLARD